MARLLARRQLIIERSDIDHLLEHLHGWVPQNKRAEYSDIEFFSRLTTCKDINCELFCDFSAAYGLTNSFKGECVYWRRIFNEIAYSDECADRAAHARSLQRNDRIDCTIELILWFVGETRRLGGSHQFSAASKFGMFLWPDLPVFVNDSVVRKNIIGSNAKAEDYRTLSEACQLLYNPMMQKPFITTAMFSDIEFPAHLTDDWLSRRLLDLALYRAEILNDPVPPPDSPRIVFCPCALPRQQESVAA